MAGALAAAEAEAAAANKLVFSYEKELLKWQRTALVTILGLLFLGFRYRRWVIRVCGIPPLSADAWCATDRARFI